MVDFSRFIEVCKHYIDNKHNPLDVSKNQLYSYRSEQSKPSRTSLILMHKDTGYSIDYLIGLSDVAKPETGGHKFKHNVKLSLFDSEYQTDVRHYIKKIHEIDRIERRSGMDESETEIAPVSTNKGKAEFNQDRFSYILQLCGITDIDFQKISKDLIPNKTVNAWRNGGIPSIRIQAMFCTMFQCSFDYICNQSNNPNLTHADEEDVVSLDGLMMHNRRKVYMYIGRLLFDETALSK